MCEHIRIRKLATLFALGSFLAAAAAAQVTVSVDASRVVRTVGPHSFGINIAIWDDQFASPTTADALMKMQVRMLRFPGGSAGDEYHFATNRSEGNTFTWTTDFDTFARTATELGAGVMITANYGTGSAEEAAAWVRYANVNSGRGFRYWEIGNEVYGSWETDHHSRPHDPKLYAEEAVNFITQMKRVDPTIRIGIAIVPGEDAFANYDDEVVTNPRTGSQHKGWTPLVLARMRELNTLPDFLSYHRYEQEPSEENDERLLQSASRWQSDIAAIRRMLTDYLGDAGAAIEILCTENNSVSFRPGKQTVSLVNALYLADTLAQSLQTEVNAVLWWNLRNAQESGNNNSSALYGWRTYGDYGVLSPMNERYPTSYIAELFAAFARPGDVVVAATSSSTSLAAYAVKRVDGSAAVLLINKTSDQANSVTIRFSGFTPATGDLSMLSYGLPNDTAGSGITRSTLRATGGAITVQAAPYSATVLITARGPSRRRAVPHR